MPGAPLHPDLSILSVQGRCGARTVQVIGSRMCLSRHVCPTGRWPDATDEKAKETTVLSLRKAKGLSWNAELWRPRPRLCCRWWRRTLARSNSSEERPRDQGEVTWFCCKDSLASRVTAVAGQSDACSALRTLLAEAPRNFTVASMGKSKCTSKGSVIRVCVCVHCSGSAAMQVPGLCRLRSEPLRGILFDVVQKGLRGRPSQKQGLRAK